MNNEIRVSWSVIVYDRRGVTLWEEFPETLMTVTECAEKLEELGSEFESPVSLSAMSPGGKRINIHL